MRKIPHSICSVIPPHILRHVAEHTDEETGARARATLAQMQAFTQKRQSFTRPVTPINTPKKRRNIYNARRQQVLPGKLVMNEKTKRSKDIEVNEAYDGSGDTYDFYDKVLNRNSIDGLGMRLDSTVHFGVHFDNALWNGSQMIYGDGDGKIFNRFTIALDVIAHELTHGVTQFSSSLGYEAQSGALNEHLSDAFGIMVKQYKLGLTAETSDWLIGKGLFGPNIQGKAVRSMAAPGSAYDDPVIGKDPQPGHMKDYQTMSDDHGGVHINSGIPNHAFYLSGIGIGGETWPVLGRIWYATLLSNVKADTQFQDFANATVAMAGKLFSSDDRIRNVVRDAWGQVGITVPGALTQPPAATKRQSLWQRITSGIAPSV
jgi:Zn-dependent metalloprotease